MISSFRIKGVEVFITRILFDLARVLMDLIRRELYAAVADNINGPVLWKIKALLRAKDADYFSQIKGYFRRSHSYNQFSFIWV